MILLYHNTIDSRQHFQRGTNSQAIPELSSRFLIQIIFNLKPSQQYFNIS
ncbi:unnamed protein product [Paramecium octaurelia]|uniref:Uncharacterized protein n=1 Tax=Paramecium octaurelia TaxID=43137 RepID=A0A8S1SS51_PAROT|nr:unnamed protein product [Paramecium octaurelia]